jgi:hypothetical protein
MIFDQSMSLITSFNLLAFSGNGLSNEEVTKELGVVISSQKCTKQIIEILEKK